MKKLLLAFAFTAVLAGCGSRESAPATAPAETGSQAAAPASPGAAPTEAELEQAATAAQESTSAADTSPGDASLERIVAMPESAQLPAGRWKAGTNYQPIVPAQATSTEPGEVEVIEFLWLGCDHCRQMQPFADSWKKSAPAYVKFVQEHVMWGPVHRAHGKLLYTLQALGRDDLITKAFDEIHGPKRNMLVAGSDAESQRLQVAFAKANGVSEADFLREYNSFAVNTRLARADELTRRYRLESVPVFIVNGKYRTDVGMAGGHNQLLQLLTDLALAERGR